MAVYNSDLRDAFEHLKDTATKLRTQLETARKERDEWAVKCGHAILERDSARADAQSVRDAILHHKSECN